MESSIVQGSDVISKRESVAKVLDEMNAQLAQTSLSDGEDDEEPIQVNEQMLQEMEKLMDAQREHLRVRESHMNIMRDALVDLTKKREELTALRVQVSDAIQRNDMNAVNEVHSRISDLEDSQTKFTEMLEASQAIRESSLYKTIDLDDEESDDFEAEAEALQFESELNGLNRDEGEFDSTDKELTNYISSNLESLLAELKSIDPTTETSDAASEWVSDERDSLISQLVELQRQSVAAHEKRNAQIAILEARQEELEEFQRQIIDLEKQAAEAEVGDEDDIEAEESEMVV
ncbi:hypothetical protein BDR26DRAFT_865503 [Obelidium mucronatum]|nr:hypothetical protein BDR26DRAFT_865503 [Obelidium mucronatum]